MSQEVRSGFKPWFRHTVLPILALLALLFLHGFHWLQSVVHKHAADIAKSAFCHIFPYLRLVLEWALAVFLLWSIYRWLKNKVDAFAEARTAHPDHPQIQKIARSLFPIFYWVLAAYLAIFFLDRTLFMGTSVFFACGAILSKSELGEVCAWLAIRGSDKCHAGETICWDGKTAEVVEVGMLLTRIKVLHPENNKTSEVRVNNATLWSTNLNFPDDDQHAGLHSPTNK
jgi:hypothetical protein